MLATLLSFGLAAVLTAADTPAPGNWCKVGQKVMIPDGREGPVVGVTGDICKVLVYGEDRLSLWAYYVIDPSYQTFGR